MQISNREDLLVQIAVVEIHTMFLKRMTIQKHHIIAAYVARKQIRVLLRFLAMHAQIVVKQ